MTGWGFRRLGVRVSVLRDRIVAQPHGSYPQYAHPHGTAATPMVMPLALVHYDETSSQYNDLHAMPATGDVNAVPLAVVAPGTFGKVVQSGRP
jgi:hypothetical protein